MLFILKWLISFFYKFGNEFYGSYKYKCNAENYMKIYTGQLLEQDSELKINVLNEISDISEKTIGRVAPYPIFEGKNMFNKTIIICYNKLNQPIATNISFNFYSNTNENTILNDNTNENINEKINVYHLGLFLIIPEYQRKGIQKELSFYNVLNNFMLDNQSELYFTDIGRSASAINGIDKMCMCYPTLNDLNNISQQFIYKCKEIAFNLYQNYAKIDCAVSEKSTYDYDNMVITNSNISGGFEELVIDKNNKSSGKVSRNKKYNDYLNDVCPNPEDELIIVFKVDYKLIVKMLIGKIFGL